MTYPVPAMVVTLSAVTAAEAKRQVVEAAAAGADLAEIRFDLWSVGARAEADQLFPCPLPLVATLRSRQKVARVPMTRSRGRRYWSNSRATRSAGSTSKRTGTSPRSTAFHRPRRSVGSFPRITPRA